MHWVAERVKSLGFQKSATRFTRDMTRRLKLTKKLSTQRAPDPDEEMAFKYARGNRFMGAPFISPLIRYGSILR